jgi:glycerol uptake facilitator-like aquaporin
VSGAHTRDLAAEGIGTAFLLAAVVGSGVMAEKLAGGNQALALLCNTLPTGAILAVLILIFAPISGAHFNPAVSLAFALRGKLPWGSTVAYIATQVLGGIVGVWLAHLMFELPLWQLSVTARVGPGQWLAEGIATFGLLLTIFGCAAQRPDAVPYAVGLYITAAYWFPPSPSPARSPTRLPGSRPPAWPHSSRRSLWGCSRRSCSAAGFGSCETCGTSATAIDRYAMWAKTARARAPRRRSPGRAGCCRPGC